MKDETWNYEGNSYLNFGCSYYYYYITGSFVTPFGQTELSTTAIWVFPKIEHSGNIARIVLG